MLTKSNTMKIERKIKNKSLVKTPSITTRLPSKKKIDLQSAKEKKEIFKSITKNSHSITSKDDIKKKVMHNHSKNNNKILLNNYNNQVLGTSNCVLPTNYTDKEEEKKRVLSNENLNKEEKNLRYLGNLFRKSNLKRTIIIDNEGNNNLNLNKNIFLDSKEKKINLQKVKNNINCFRHDNTKNVVNENKIKKKKTHNKVISDNIVPSSIKLKEIKFSKENDQRLKEYGEIFNLLNTNIEEMKDMFRKSPLKKDDEYNYFHNLKIKKNKNQSNINFNKNSQNYFKNIQIFSEEDCSFDFSSVISNKSDSIIINTNSDKTQCELDENLNDNNNYIHNFDINPHTLISKKNENNNLNKCKNGSKSTSNLNLSNDKCSVF